MLVARQRRALVTGLGGGREREREAAAKASFAERRMRASDTAPVATLQELPAGFARDGPAGGARSFAQAAVGMGARAGADAGARPSGSREQMQPAGPVDRAGPGNGAGADRCTVPAPGAGTDPAARATPGEPSVALPGPGFDAGARRAAAATTRLQLDDALVVPAGALVRGYLRCRALLLAGDIVGNVHCTAGPVVIRTGASLKGRLVAAGDVYVCGAVGDSGGGAVITTCGKLTLAPGGRVDGDVRSGRLDLHDGCALHGVARASED